MCSCTLDNSLEVLSPMVEESNGIASLSLARATTFALYRDSSWSDEALYFAQKAVELGEPGGHEYLAMISVKK